MHRKEVAKVDIMHKRLVELLTPKGSIKQLSDYLIEHGEKKAPNTVGGWKSGISENYKKYLPQIADCFDVNIEWLSGKSNDKNGHKKIAPTVSGKSDNRRLLDSYLDEFTDAEIEKLLVQIKSERNM